jgi:hypothetical protein
MNVKIAGQRFVFCRYFFRSKKVRHQRSLFQWSALANCHRGGRSEYDKPVSAGAPGASVFMTQYCSFFCVTASTAPVDAVDAAAWSRLTPRRRQQRLFVSFPPLRVVDHAHLGTPRYAADLFDFWGFFSFFFLLFSFV